MLVFRRFRGHSREREILFRFVVPETPATGISGPPFFAAMHLASALATGAQKPGIGLWMLSFSGSFFS